MNDADLLELIDDPALRREAPAVEVVEALLARIEDRNPSLNAYLAVTADLALAAARAVDEARAAGRDPGPLDGMPVGVKDNIDVAGIPATAGTAVFRERVPARDAETVRRLRAAGGVVIGKTALHEFAFGATTNNPHFGPTRNPWDTSRIPGGSSGGSGAALGADLCIGALGTDTGGSVRVPAAFNGVSSLRPTFGAISVRGVLALCPSLDTVGPMARALGDVARLAAVLIGYDREDPYAVEPPKREPLPPDDGSLRGLRVGLPAPFFFDPPVEPVVAANARAAAGVLAELGASVAEVEIDGAEQAMADTTTIIRAEALAEHRERFETDPGSIGEDVRRRFASGLEISGVQLAEAYGRMRRWRRRMLSIFDDVDVLLTAATPASAPPIEGAETIATSAHATRLCYPWSLAGMPAVVVPCGFDEIGLPTGLQLAAAPWRDDLALRAGAAYQRATSFHRQRPQAAAVRS